MQPFFGTFLPQRLSLKRRGARADFRRPAADGLAVRPPRV